MDNTKYLKDKEWENDIVSNMSFSQFTNNVGEYIYNYAIYTKRHYNKETPLYLGGVAFWLEEHDNQVILMYNIEPKHWNKNRLISDFEKEERQYLEQVHGLGIHHNPQ